MDDRGREFESLLDCSEDEKTFDINIHERRDLAARKMKTLISCLVFGLLISFAFGVSVGALLGYGNSPRNYDSLGWKNGASGNSETDTRWTYDCINSKCNRRAKLSTEPQVSLETCNMFCSTPSLWPKPNLSQINNATSSTFTREINCSFSDTRWTYDCINSKCNRRAKLSTEPQVTLETCNMFCSTPSLWPKPKLLQKNNASSSTFTRENITLTTNVPTALEEDLGKAYGIFLSNIPIPQEQNKKRNTSDSEVHISITITSSETKLTSTTNESYRLQVIQTQAFVLANITAQTYFGARHALETLSQLIWLDSSMDGLKIYHDVLIEDSPAFSHRGVMVDTARNFFPVAQLLRVVEGMAASKLNVLHLHLTDAVSFPVVLPHNPQFAKYGAYRPDQIYTADDIKGLVEFARIRGIRTILEIDAPGHVNEGWNSERKIDDKLVICGENDVFNGHLNPDNADTLDVLQSVYQDLLLLGTDPETFHIGGDEVNLTCYEQTDYAMKFESVYKFWADWANNIFERAVRANHNIPPKNLVIWSSPLTDSFIRSLNYSENLVVQYWFGDLGSILRNGNKVIISTVGKWYLDCGFGPWRPSQVNGVCDPYTSWQTFYKYRPWGVYNKNVDQVLGGEACLWSEQVDVSNLETRIWPRAAAMAERLWTDEKNFNDYDVYTRISSHRDRLIKRGFRVSAIWPNWCTLNPGKC